MSLQQARHSNSVLALADTQRITAARLTRLPFSGRPPAATVRVEARRAAAGPLQRRVRQRRVKALVIEVERLRSVWTPQEQHAAAEPTTKAILLDDARTRGALAAVHETLLLRPRDDLRDEAAH